MTAPSGHRAARIIKTQPAGPAHVVLSVSGGPNSYRRSPCVTCPWRKDMVGEFPAEAFHAAANSGTDGANFTLAAMSTFACHASGPTKPAICAGYILCAQDAIGWRLAASRGKFNPKKVRTRGLALFTSYYAMAVANGVPADDPAMIACRPFGEKAT